MSLEDILLNEISQTYKDKYCMIWFICELKKKIQAQKQNRMLFYQELEHEEKEEIFFKKERKRK